MDSVAPPAESVNADGKTISIRACPQLPSLDCLVDHVLTMKKRERTSYRYILYCCQPCKAVALPILLVSTWREQICEWAYSVVDHFDLSRETVAVTLSLLDRFLAAQSQEGSFEEGTVSSSVVLLSAMACLQLAAKLNEPRRFRLDHFCKLSNGRFPPQLVEESERHILSVLDWKVNPPTALDFTGHLLLFLLLESECGDSVHKIYEVARFVIELSVCDEYFVPVDTSLVATAAILVATEDIPATSALLPAQAKRSFFKTLSVTVQLNANDPQVQAVRLKLLEAYRDNTICRNTEADISHSSFICGSPTSVMDRGASGEVTAVGEDLRQSELDGPACRPNKRRFTSKDF